MNSLNVLAIEDDQYDALQLERMLRDAGTFEIRFEHAQASRGARRVLANRPFDVVFLDYRLGPENGIEVLRAIRGDGHRGPIILLTGAGSERVAAEAARAGGDDYLRKDDLTPATLSDCLERVLARYAGESSRRRFEGSLYELATCDPLTGLFNRRYFTERLGEESLRTARFGNPLTLLVLDVDGFDAIVQDLGREGADAVLGNIGVTLRGLLRVTDLFCRYEADRFAVALIETTEEQAAQCAHKVRSVLAEAPLRSRAGEPMPLRFTIALRPVTEADPDACTLLIEAFSAIVQAKRDGGHRVVVARPSADG